MLHNVNREQKSPAKRFLFILGVLIFICYLTAGLALIFWKELVPQFENPYRTLFAILIIVYAFFRFIRLVRAKED